MPLTFAFGESNFLQIEDDGYSAGVSSHRTTYHDLSELDFDVLEGQKFFIPKWIDEPGDFSDILQVRFNVTNNGLEHFAVYKNIFQIDVMDPREQYQEFRRTNQDNIVDNYYPQYIEDFKLRFQDIALPQSLFECELLNHSLRVNQTQTLSVCFDVKQKWSNESLDLNGPKLYYLVMMDNKFTTSCPNCKSVLLNEYYKNPITQSDLPPREQISLGVSVHEISCKEGLQLIFKNFSNPACVKPSSIEKLIERGWALSKNEQSKSISSLSAIMSEQNVMDGARLNVISEIINGEKYLVFKGFGWHKSHNVEITITNDNEKITFIQSKTNGNGVLYVPWLLPGNLSNGLYKIHATDGLNQNKLEIAIPLIPMNFSQTSSEFEVEVNGEKQVRRGTTHSIEVQIHIDENPIEDARVFITIEDYGEDIIREFNGHTNQEGYLVFSWEIPQSFDDIETLLAFVDVTDGISSKTEVFKFQVYCLPGEKNCNVEGN